MIEQLSIDSTPLINEVVLNWNSTRLACCSEDSNTVKIYKQNERDKSNWELSKKVTIDSPPKKLKWAHSDFGNAFAVKTVDNRIIVYKEKAFTQPNESNVPTKINRWEPIYEENASEEEAFVRDIKFAPSHFGYAISVVYDNGVLKVVSLDESTSFEKQATKGKVICKEKISSKPLKAFSWKKDEGKIDAVVVCYSEQSSKNSAGSDRISLWGYKENLFLIDPLKQINDKHDSEIEDVNWAISNGRSFHLVCSCGKSGILVWRMTINETNDPVTATILDTFRDGASVFSYPVRCKFNHVASFIATVTNTSRMRVWRKAKDWEWKGEPEIQCKKSVN